jgi:hypothetical protein
VNVKRLFLIVKIIFYPLCARIEEFLLPETFFLKANHVNFFEYFDGNETKRNETKRNETKRNHCFILLGFAEPFLNRLLHINPLRIKYLNSIKVSDLYFAHIFKKYIQSDTGATLLTSKEILFRQIFLVL